MPERPTGTVTFRFTDIEGSTALWEFDEAAMRVGMARHNEILRSVVQDNDGVVFKHTGDGMCPVFSDPVAALRAASTARHALDSEPWGTVSPIRARMGVHTGVAQERGGDFR